MFLDLIFGRFRRKQQIEEPRHSSIGVDAEEEDSRIELDDPFPDIVVVEFRDVIDLHSIPARQVRAVVEDYLEEAHRRGARWVRIVHGKGIGVQREMVRSILSRTPYVADYRDAPAEAGGWGATLVTLLADDSQPTAAE